MRIRRKRKRFTKEEIFGDPKDWISFHKTCIELTGLTNIIYFPMPRFKRIGKIYTTTRGTGSWDKNTVSEIKLRKSKGIDEYGNVTQVNRRVR